MRAVVFAYHDMGITGLDALKRNGYDIVGLFTHEDDPGETCWFGSVSRWGQDHDVPVFTEADISHPRWIESIRELKPDVIFSFYYRKMIPPAILDIPRAGAFNLHGSLLPAYRGRCPVNWVLVNGEARTGVTLHEMVEKPDAGDIVGQKAVDIAFDDTAQTLFERLCVVAKELLDEVLPLILQGRAQRIPQDLSQGSYYGGRRPEDGRIDWTASANTVYNLIRAVTSPYPGAFTLTPQGEKILIWWGRATKSDVANTPGHVCLIGEDVFVQTGKHAIELHDIEAGGKRLLGRQIAEFFTKGKVTQLQ